MSIVRAPRPESSFYILDKAISEDKRLGWAARGFLIYLLGKPDHWKVSIQALVNETSESSERSARDRTYAIINQLIDAGYIVRSQGKSDGGKFAAYDYVVSEKPVTDLPYTDCPDTAEPYPAKPTQVSTDVQQGMKEPVSTDGAVAPTASRKQKFDPMTAKPANVSVECWMDWCQHRREIRKPLTAASCRHQAKQLEAHPNPDHVLNLSIANGWTGLFPEKVNAISQHPRAAGRPSAVDQVRAAIEARAAAEAAPGAAGQPVAENDRDVRAPLDGEFRRVG